MSITLRSGSTVLIAAVLAVAIGPAPAHADETRDKQWALAALDISKAHKETRGAGVTIGLIDSGVDADHPDLKDNIKPGMSTWDDDGDGLNDTLGHGTSMASLLVGHGHGNSDGNGILGIAPEAKVMPVSVFPPSYKDNPTDLDANAQAYDGTVEGIRWLADQDVDVILVPSGGGGGKDLQEAVSYVIEEKGIPLVASAGNAEFDGDGNPERNRIVSAPAAFEGAFAISGTTQSGEFWAGSVYGREVAFSAPAKDIVSGKKGGGYDTASGTSDASSITAGVVALMKAQWPDMGWKDIHWRLSRTADDKGKSGPDQKFGYGIINPVKALTSHVDPPDGIDDEQINPPVDPKASPKPSNDESKDDTALTGSTGGSTWLIVGIVAAVVILGGGATVLWLRRKRGVTQQT